MDALLRIRQVFSKQGTTVKAVGKKFIVADQNRDDKLDITEWKKCLESYGITDMTDDQIKYAFNQVDKSGTGFIDYDEFLNLMRGQEMNEFRKDMAIQAFILLDKERHGFLTKQKLA